jgi:ATP synthase protein I
MLPTRKDKPMLRVLMKASMVGIQLVVATFIGLAIGYFLDDLFGKFGIHTKPWLTFIFLGLGIFTGFRDLFRMAKDAMEDTKNDSASGLGEGKDEGRETGYQRWEDDDEDKDRS